MSDRTVLGGQLYHIHAHGNCLLTSKCPVHDERDFTMSRFQQLNIHLYYLLTTYRTTSPSILVQLKNLKQIRDRESTSKLSADSDCSHRHCFKIHLRWYRTNMAASGLYFCTANRTTSPSILIQIANLKQIRDREKISKLSADSDCSKRHCFKICLWWHRTNVAASGLYSAPTNRTTCPSILVQMTNLKQIWDRENISKLSADSDCMKRHCSKICLWWYRTIAGSGLHFCKNKSDHKSINSGPNDEFETDLRLRKHIETFCRLRLFAMQLLQNSIFLGPCEAGDG